MISNLTCATSADLKRLASFNFILFQFINLIAAIFTFFFSFFAVKAILNRSIFQNSTKILLFSNLIYAIVYQISYSIEALSIIYKHFFLSDRPCELLQLETDCSPYAMVLLGSASGMVYCQTGLIIERTFATFQYNYNGSKSIFIGCIIVIVVFVFSALTGPAIYWDDPLTSASLACFIFPKQSATRSVIYFYVTTGITIFNLATSIPLNQYNTKLEYRIRFKLCARFHKREVIESTGTICFLTFAQFIFMFIYSFGVSLMKTIRSIISVEEYQEWVTRFYTVPFIAMLFPILLTYRISKTKNSRTQVLVGMASTKQSQEEHINQMKSMWE